MYVPHSFLKISVAAKAAKNELTGVAREFDGFARDFGAPEFNPCTRAISLKLRASIRRQNANRQRAEVETIANILSLFDAGVKNRNARQKQFTLNSAATAKNLSFYAVARPGKPNFFRGDKAAL